MPNLTRIQTGDENIDRLQSNIQQAINGITSQFIGGRFLQNISLVSGKDNAITHKLGRQPQLWVICDQNAGTNIWRTAWDSNFLTLQCGADCTVSLWVN